MKILGIIAEYDPFHRGHLFHLTEAKKLVSPDLTYIVLSPCVKQRGELSLLSPSDRARCALESGAEQFQKPCDTEPRRSTALCPAADPVTDDSKQSLFCFTPVRSILLIGSGSDIAANFAEHSITSLL